MSITADTLKEYVNYDPDTGVFNRIKPASKFSNKLGVLDRNDCGYIRFVVCGHKDFGHRWAFLYMTGSFPDDMVDHINHNKLDNRWENLRPVTNQENQRNMKVPKDNTSGVVGVYWHKPAKRWLASIRVDNRLVHLGSFASFSDAVDARKNAEVLYGFHENHGKAL